MAKRQFKLTSAQEKELKAAYERGVADAKWSQEVAEIKHKMATMERAIYELQVAMAPRQRW